MSETSDNSKVWKQVAMIVGAVLSVVAGGGAEVALSKNQLAEHEARITKVENTVSGAEVERAKMGQKLDDIGASVTRIEHLLERGVK